MTPWEAPYLSRVHVCNLINTCLVLKPVYMFERVAELTSTCSSVILNLLSYSESFLESFLLFPPIPRYCVCMPYCDVLVCFRVHSNHSVAGPRVATVLAPRARAARHGAHSFRARGIAYKRSAGCLSVPCSSPPARRPFACQPHPQRPRSYSELR